MHDQPAALSFRVRSRGRRFFRGAEVRSPDNQRSQLKTTYATPFEPTRTEHKGLGNRQGERYEEQAEDKGGTRWKGIGTMRKVREKVMRARNGW